MVIWIIGIYIIGAIIGFAISYWNNDITTNLELIESNSIFWFVWFIKYLPKDIQWFWNLIVWTWKNLRNN